MTLEEEPNDRHFHCCQDCAHVWFHRKSEIINRREAHLCPECKSGPYFEGVDTRREASELSRIYKLAKSKSEVT